MQRSVAPRRQLYLMPFGCQEWSLVVLCLLLTGGLACWFASPYPIPGVRRKATAGGAFFCVAVTVAFVHCFRRSERGRWTNTLVFGFLMLAAAAIGYSLVRHQTVLVPFPALFALPGVVLGGAAGEAVSEWWTARLRQEGDRMNSVDHGGSQPAPVTQAHGAERQGSSSWDN
jgi:hypothetical protein